MKRISNAVADRETGKEVEERRERWIERRVISAAGLDGEERSDRRVSVHEVEFRDEHVVELVLRLRLTACKVQHIRIAFVEPMNERKVQQQQKQRSQEHNSTGKARAERAGPDVVDGESKALLELRVQRERRRLRLRLGWGFARRRGGRGSGRAGSGGGGGGSEQRDEQSRTRGEHRLERVEHRAVQLAAAEKEQRLEKDQLGGQLVLLNEQCVQAPTHTSFDLSTKTDFLFAVE